MSSTGCQICCVKSVSAVCVHGQLLEGPIPKYNRPMIRHESTNHNDDSFSCYEYYWNKPQISLKMVSS